MKDLTELSRYWREVSGQRVRIIKHEDGTKEKQVVEGWDDKKNIYYMDYLIHTIKNHDPVLILFHSQLDIISKRYKDEIGKSISAFIMNSFPVFRRGLPQ